MLSVSLAFSRLLKTACPRCYKFQNYATRKRFYRGTSVVQSDNKWEVTLDHRRLKTPNGQVLAVNSESLARAIAAEWDAQTEHISQPTMHLTALCNTARDNPGKLTSHDIASYLLDYISTDTILFFSEDEKELQMLQEKKWTPIIDWFEKKFNVTQEVATSLVPPPVTVETRAVLARYFLSYDFEALTAMSFGAEALKSPILMLACIERHIEPKEAVLLARLEEEYQRAKTHALSEGRNRSVSQPRAEVELLVLCDVVASPAQRLSWLRPGVSFLPIKRFEGQS